jgi:hypothetical protein
MNAPSSPKTIPLLCAAIALAWATPARAQVENQNAGLELSTSTGIPITLSLGAVVYFVDLGIEERNEELLRELKFLEEMTLIDAYVERNASALAMAVTLGGGELDDLAALMGHPGGFAPQRARAALDARRPALRRALALPARDAHGDLLRARALHAILRDALDLPLTEQASR